MLWKNSSSKFSLFSVLSRSKSFAKWFEQEKWISQLHIDRLSSSYFKNKSKIADFSARNGVSGQNSMWICPLICRNFYSMSISVTWNCFPRLLILLPNAHRLGTNDCWWNRWCDRSFQAKLCPTENVKSTSWRRSSIVKRWFLLSKDLSFNYWKTSSMQSHFSFLPSKTNDVFFRNTHWNVSEIVEQINEGLRWVAWFDLVANVTFPFIFSSHFTLTFLLINQLVLNRLATSSTSSFSSLENYRLNIL